MDAVAPGVAEGLHLLGLAGDVLGVAVLHVAAGGAPLEVAVEFDAVGRIEIDALHAAGEAFALGQARHHLQAVAEDHAVGPVAVVAVELGPGVGVGQAVEVGEEVQLRVGRARADRLRARLAAPAQVVDQRLGVDLLLDVERRRVDDEVGGILPILAAPHQLRIEIAVAAFVGDAHRRTLVLLHHRLVFGGGDVLARGLVVDEGFDCERGGLVVGLGHGGSVIQALASPCRAGAVRMS